MQCILYKSYGTSHSQSKMSIENIIKIVTVILSVRRCFVTVTIPKKIALKPKKRGGGLSSEDFDTFRDSGVVCRRVISCVHLEATNIISIDHFHSPLRALPSNICSICKTTILQANL